MTDIARSARGPELQEPHAEDALAEPYLVQKILVTWLQQIDISEKLIVGQSDEIYGVTPINWEDSSGEHLSLIDVNTTPQMTYFLGAKCVQNNYR